MLQTATPMLRRFWYPVIPMAQLQDGPKPFRLLGQDIVLWVDGDGKPAAMDDRCCHRTAKLSKGFYSNGWLACGYHGWEFGADGRVIERGAEVRFGQGLADMVGASAFDPNKSAWYFFAASDGQALTWAPGTLEGLAYQQKRITVGDLQAGFSYERHGVQTSFSYLQREVSNSTRGAGAQSRSETESFVGATITVRR